MFQISDSHTGGSWFLTANRGGGGDSGGGGGGGDKLSLVSGTYDLTKCLKPTLWMNNSEEKKFIFCI